MPSAKSTVAAGTRLIGQLISDGDLVVEGHIEGGPLLVSGLLTVAPGATVHCAEAEVGEALVGGLFQGTLRARDVVRIHSGGRIIGDILASRVVFVSDPAPIAAGPPPPAPAATGSLVMPHAEPPHQIPANKPVSRSTPPARPTAPTPVPAPAAAASPPPVRTPTPAPVAPPPAVRPAPVAPPPAARPAPVAQPATTLAPAPAPRPVAMAPAAPLPVANPAPPAPAVAAAPPAAPAAPRAIPSLPSIGQRAMERKE